MAVLTEERRQRRFPGWGWALLAVWAVVLLLLVLSLPWYVKLTPRLTVFCKPGDWEWRTVVASGRSSSTVYRQCGPVLVVEER